MIKITKSILIKESLSEDKIVQVVNLYFTNKYRTDWMSNLKCKFKKTHSFQSNGWEIIQKQLSPTNCGILTFKDNSIKLELTLIKQFVISILGGILLTLIIWKGYNVIFIISIVIILIIEIIIWITIINIGKQFMKKSLTEIKEKMN